MGIVDYDVEYCNKLICDFMDDDTHPDKYKNFGYLICVLQKISNLKKNKPMVTLHKNTCTITVYKKYQKKVFQDEHNEGIITFMTKSLVFTGKESKCIRNNSWIAIVEFLKYYYKIY